MTEQECFEAAKKCGLTNAEFSAWRHTIQLYAAEIEKVVIEKEKLRVLKVIAQHRDASLFMSNRSNGRPESHSCKAIVEALNLIIHQLGNPGTDQPVKDDGKTRVADHIPDVGKMIESLEKAAHRITALEDKVSAMERRIQGLEWCEQARQPIGSPRQNGWPRWPARTGPYQAPNIGLQAESKAGIAKAPGLAK